MISDAERRAAGWSFNYDGAQWRVISELVDRNCPQDEERFSYWGLLEAANDYLRDTAQSRGEAAKRWRAIAHLMKRARELVPKPNYAEQHDSLLAQIEEVAQSATRNEKYEEAFARGSWKPRQVFYHLLLECWGDAAGLFRRSRSTPPVDGARWSGRPGGPTVLYFEAVAGPVMGRSAPGRERICQLIVEHKEFDKQMQADMDAADARARSGR
jgi:hypothetical protein